MSPVWNWSEIEINLSQPKMDLIAELLYFDLWSYVWNAVVQQFREQEISTSYLPKKNWFCRLQQPVVINVLSNLSIRANRRRKRECSMRLLTCGANRKWLIFLPFLIYLGVHFTDTPSVIILLAIMYGMKKDAIEMLLKFSLKVWGTFSNFAIYCHSKYIKSHWYNNIPSNYILY